MKQTKPYGRAFVPASELAKAQNPAQEKTKEISPQKSTSTPSVELFDLGGSKFDKQTTAKSNPIQKIIRDGSISLGVSIILLGAYIGMRDSMRLASILDVMPTEETVMICKDGKVVYKDDFSVIDRLLNQGNFVCTDWHVQRGFLTIPRN